MKRIISGMIGVVLLIILSFAESIVVQAVDVSSMPLPRVTLAGDSAKEWKASGFSTTEMIAWKDTGFSLGEAVWWKDYGFSLSEAVAWSKAGFSAPQAFDWNRHGFTPTEAISWHDKLLKSVSNGEQLAAVLTSIDDGEIAWECRHTGFTLSQAQQVARRMKMSLVSPIIEIFSDLRVNKKNWINKLQTIQKACGYIPKTIGIPADNSPYLLIYKCLLLDNLGGNVSIFQLVNRTKALMKYDVEGTEPTLFFLDTYPNVLNVNFFPAVVKVSNVFKYKTSIGSLNIVPSVRVVSSLGN
ncbi:MAG: hypothetical protein ACYCT9_05020 [Leptospirillum sp.]|jgi:hypothetical protein